MTDPTQPTASSDLGTTVRRPRRRRRDAVRRTVVAVVAVAALIGIGATVVAATASSSTQGFRTATAATRSVDEVMQLVATVEPVSQASVAFPVAGTVSTVGVQPGDTVATGTTLATLDTAALEEDVDTARAELDQAEYLLERALDGEDVSGMAGGGSGAPSGGTSLGGGMATSASGVGTSPDVQVQQVSATPTRATSSGDDSVLRQAQQAVLDAQSAVSAATNAAATALETAAAACGSTDDPADPGDGDNTACLDALEQAFNAQQALSAAQTTLNEAATALTELLAVAEEPDREAESTTPPSADGPPEGGSPGGGTPEGGAPDSGTVPGGDPSGSAPSESAPETGAATSSPTAEELIAYQKAVDAAAAHLTVAEQALGQARIVSPISGTVVAVGLDPGDQVEATSSTATVVVVGDGGYEVTALVSVDDLPAIEVGQAATVQPDGDRPSIEGEVVRIGITASSSSEGSGTTYPVTIGLIDQPSGLGNGSTATVQVVTESTTEAVAVPTSAVSASGGSHTVQVPDGSDVREVTVEVGAIGDTWTEIVDGIEVGDTVILADLDEALPGSATDTDSSSNQGGGGFPGGGGGGFPGGGGGSPGGGGPPGGG